MNWAIKNPSFSRKVCTPDVNYMEMLEIMADWGKPKVKLTHGSSRKQLAMVSISSIDLLGVMDRRFPFTHETIHGEFGAIKGQTL